MVGGDDNTRAAWVCAIWCGIAARRIRELKAREEGLSEKSSQQIRSAITMALQGHPYLEEPAREALEILNR